MSKGSGKREPEIRKSISMNRVGGANPGGFTLNKSLELDSGERGVMADFDFQQRLSTCSSRPCVVSLVR
jgi:hypothetical protein